MVSVLFRVNRRVLSDDLMSVELHGFCDSSISAYGAAIYVRIVTKSDILSQLWTAKSRIASMKENNIPRLELLSCLLLSKLTNSLLNAVKNEIKFDRINC